MATILIVEDDFIQAAALELAVMQLGHEPLPLAASVSQALELLAKATPDVALVDLLLRDEDAGCVIAELAKRSVPLAVLTAAGQEVDRRFKEHLVIHKPADSETVAGAIELLRWRRDAID